MLNVNSEEADRQDFVGKYVTSSLAAWACANKLQVLKNDSLCYAHKI